MLNTKLLTCSRLLRFAFQLAHAGMRRQNCGVASYPSIKLPTRTLKPRRTGQYPFLVNSTRRYISPLLAVCLKSAIHRFATF
ncbi:Uncharacterised protein [Vibrio cholerae]|nr:Uncharacterised protein [Vibrio cholerae]